MNARRTLGNLAVSVVICLIATSRPGNAEQSGSAAPEEAWAGTWATAPQLAASSDVPPETTFADTTLRQFVRISVGGLQLRVRFSNAFGTTPLGISAAHVALSAGGGAIKAGSDRPLTFAGKPTVSVPPGALAISDPIDFAAPALGELAVSLHITDAPAGITSHPGSRTTSYLMSGNAVSQPEMSQAVLVDHWYFLNGIDVAVRTCPRSIVILGDSIADGRGSTTNGNNRWPDVLAERLHHDKHTVSVGVLNHGMGGNRLLRDGIGPNALARFDRDVLAQTGVRWLIVAEGINDIGTRLRAAEKNEGWAASEDVIQAYQQIVMRAHAHGIKVYGATLLPFGGSFYDSADTEKERDEVNEWIRTGGVFDGVIDFDQRLRATTQPARLAAEVDGGDHLHPNAAGYRQMGEAVDLRLFEEKRCTNPH